MTKIRKAGAAMQELLAVAAELRPQVDFACAQNPEETGEWNQAAAALETGVQRLTLKDYLRPWRRNIQ